MSNEPTLDPPRVAWWKEHPSGGFHRVYADPKTPSFHVNFVSPNGTAYLSRWDFLEEQVVERSGEAAKLLKFAAASRRISRDIVSEMEGALGAIKNLGELVTEAQLEGLLERFDRASQMILMSIDAQGGIA